MDWTEYGFPADISNQELIIYGVLYALFMWLGMTLYQWWRGSPPPVPPPEAIRKLGWMEVLFEVFMKKMKFGHLTYIVHITSKGTVTVEMLNKVMEVVASKFPSMRVRIIQKDNLYYFAEIKKGQTFDIEDCGEQNWEEALDDVTDDGIDSTAGPMWKLRLCKTSDSGTDDGPKKYCLILVFNHAICDGKSCVYVVNELVDGLCRLMDGTELPQLNDVHIADRFPLSSYDSISDNFKKTTIGQCYKVFKFFLTQFFASPNEYLKVYPPVVNRNPDVKLMQKHIYFELPTDKLLSRCRANGVTIQSVANTVPAIAMHNVMNRAKPTPRLDAMMVYAVNTRRFCEPPVDDGELVCHAFDIHAKPIKLQKTEIDDAEFWKLTKKAFVDIQDNINSGEVAKLFATMSQYVPIDSVVSVFMKTKPGEREPQLFYITNVGNVEHILTSGKVGDAVEIQNLMWTTEAKKWGPLFVHYLLSCRGRLMWTMSYFPHIVTEEQANDVAQEIQNVFKQYFDL